MDASAHDDEVRQLQRACADLVQEFGGRLPEDEVKARFEEIVDGFRDAPVRNSGAVLAGRAARERLRRLAAV